MEQYTSKQCEFQFLKLILKQELSTLRDSEIFKYQELSVQIEIRDLILVHEKRVYTKRFYSSRLRNICLLFKIYYAQISKFWFKSFSTDYFCLSLISRYSPRTRVANYTSEDQMVQSF